MDFVSWIIVGLAAVWFGGSILKRNANGPFMDAGMGVSGAVAGALLMQSGSFSRRRKSSLRRGPVDSGSTTRQKEVCPTAVSLECTEV